MCEDASGWCKKTPLVSAGNTKLSVFSVLQEKRGEIL